MFNFTAAREARCPWIKNRRAWGRADYIERACVYNRVGSGDRELSPIFGDGVNGQAAAFWGSAADFAATSIPSLNFTPRMIFGNRS